MSVLFASRMYVESRGSNLTCVLEAELGKLDNKRRLFISLPIDSLFKIAIMA